mgnify:FL=1
MTDSKIKQVVIVGGGTAGWLSAALLVKVLGKAINITLVESEQVGTIGVGEATIPPIVDFNRALGIDEKEFLSATNGTIKLGISFEDWTGIGDSYMHAFGGVGKNLAFCDFHHLWLRSRNLGNNKPFGHYSLNYRAACANKFAKLNNIQGTNLPGLVYAYHFDAGLYAKLLRRISEAQGVKRIEGFIEQVTTNDESGFVEELHLRDGQVIKGDLFIDCSGLAALLIDKTLNTGFEDWSHWLPCDRAVAVPSKSIDELRPYTRSIARSAGWQWQIPLQHRLGNGLVYSSKYLSDEEASQQLLQGLDSEALEKPRVISFKTGRRLKQWHKNVVSIGLSSGFLEPLESTSIHLIQTAVTRLIKFFPNTGIKQCEVDEFNNQSKAEYESVRDFIILHYKINKRSDTKFWRDCQRMDIPTSLAAKISLFKQSGKVFSNYNELFTDIAWQQVMLGQGLIPDDYHPMADTLTVEQISDLMTSLDTLIERTVESVPTHQQFLGDTDSN